MELFSIQCSPIFKDHSLKGSDAMDVLKNMAKVEKM